MSMFSNYEVTKKFFEVYFRTFKPEGMDLITEKFIAKIYEQEGQNYSIAWTLPTYLSMEASEKTGWSFFGDLLFKVMNLPAAFLDEVIAVAKSQLADSRDDDYDFYTNWNEEVMKDVVLDAIREGKVDLPKSQAAAARNLTIKELIFPDFKEKDVFEGVMAEGLEFRGNRRARLAPCFSEL